MPEDNNEREALKPCPFCGCEKVIVCRPLRHKTGLRCYAECQRCYTRGPEVKTGGINRGNAPLAMSRAAEAWNARHEEKPPSQLSTTRPLSGHTKVPNDREITQAIDER